MTVKDTNPETNESPVRFATTAVEVRLEVVAISTCPKCLKRIEVRRRLTEEAIHTGNTTETARYHVRQIRGLVEAERGRRGWTMEFCGACRDDGPVRSREVPGVASPEQKHEGQDDCG